MARRATAAGPDPLGLRRVLGDRLLPVLVAAMAFLAALALGGAIAAQTWADRWRLGAGTALTAQVPRPDEATGDAAGTPTRLERSLALLRASPAIATARMLSADELAELLRPWLGSDRSLPAGLLPAVIAVRAVADPPGGEAAFERLAETLRTAVPGAVLESHATWVSRLASLLRALEACGWGALLLVVAVATLVVAAATRAGLVARRATVDLLHGLGATDVYVATRFARRAMALAAIGGVGGTILALPVLLGVARLARPFGPAGAEAGITATAWGLPALLWLGLAVLPLSAAAIGYVTAQGTVRIWLRRLP